MFNPSQPTSAGPRPSSNDSADRGRSALEAVGLRYTIQRAAIYRCLAGLKSHPTVEEVYRRVRRRLPRISLATVYKALEALVVAGLATKLVGGDRSRTLPPARHADRSVTRLADRVRPRSAQQARSGYDPAAFAGRLSSLGLPAGSAGRFCPGRGLVAVGRQLAGRRLAALSLAGRFSNCSGRAGLGSAAMPFGILEPCAKSIKFLLA
jgi:hypothetical protein